MFTLSGTVRTMIGYTKLFQNIITSSIWGEDDKTRIVWITMLALCNRDGIVEASVSGLAALSRVDKESAARAIQVLESPDPDSRSKEHEGRRIQRVDGGWLILNHAKYRKKLSLEERRDYLTLKQREYRDRKRIAQREMTARDIIRDRVKTEQALKEDPVPYNNGLDQSTLPVI